MNRARVQRGDEALDLFFHVRVHELLEVRQQRVRSVIELFVEVLDRLAVEDPGALPLTVRAPQQELPTLLAGLLPCGGIDQLRRALGADMEVDSGSGRGP